MGTFTISISTSLTSVGGVGVLYFPMMKVTKLSGGLVSKVAGAFYSGGPGYDPLEFYSLGYGKFMHLVCRFHRRDAVGR